MFMSLRNRFALAIALTSLAFLIACGGSSVSITPPPSGGFSNSDLNGTYVFSFTGTDTLNNTFFNMAGTFSANGSGGIGSGTTVDINDGTYGPLVGVTITGGSYTITSDGRGRGTLSTNSADDGLASIGIDFVLTSDSHGVITRFDSDGTGSGTLDLQSTVTQSNLTSYSFSLTGVGQNGFFASVGTFTLGGTTTISNGLQDFNDNEVSNGLTDLTLTGSVTLGSNGQGTAQLTATNSLDVSTFGTLQFDVFAIDATHLKLIETDGVELLGGDGYTQQATLASGTQQLVYTMVGADSSGYIFSAGGFMTYDGSSAISSGIEDVNDSGTSGSSPSVSGSLTTAGGGRYQLTLGGLVSTNGSSTYTYTGYPFVSGGTTGVLLLETDGIGTAGGTAFVQSAQTFPSTEGYGLNLSGQNSGGEVDTIAEFVVNSGGTLSDGIFDENDQNSGSELLNWKQPLGNGGQYAFDSPATGRGEISYPNASTSFAGELNLIFYVVDSSDAIFIDSDYTTIDAGQVAVGTLTEQTTPSSKASALAHTQSHFAALRAAKAAGAWRHKKSH